MENTVENKNTIENLQKDNFILREKYSLLEEQNKELSKTLDLLLEQIHLGRHKQFGASSEQTNPDQICIFNEAEAFAKPDAPEPTVEEITYKRRKVKGHREEMFKDLPVEIIEYHLSEEEQICSCCGGHLHEMSTEVRKEIKAIPATIAVVHHKRFVYGCRDCERNAINTPIITAPMPKPALPGSAASASAIAYIMSEKFVMGSPLYRQAQQLERMGFALSRQTMANWMIQGSQRYLSCIYERMKYHLLNKDILHADESTLQVLKEPGRSASTNSYMWMYRTGRYEIPIIIYEYQMTRARKHPEKFLHDFKGYLNCDGYSGYIGLPQILLVGCWAHAKRGFFDSLKSLPPSNKVEPTAAQEGLNFCNKLYSIEKKLRDVTPEERYENRQQLIVPLLNDFKEWLRYQRQRLTPKSATGKAVNYCLNQWERLQGFLKDGRLEFDNNRGERAFKSYVIGRKNWLFSATPDGATSSAVIYSVIETCKENRLIPFEYLKFLFEKLPNIDLEDNSVLDLLLPWSAELPSVCFSKKK